MAFVLFSTFALIARLSSCSNASLVMLESQNRLNGTDIPNNSTLGPALTTTLIPTTKPTDDTTIVNTDKTETTTLTTTPTTTAKSSTTTVTTTTTVAFNTEDLNDKIDKNLERRVWNQAEDNEPPEFGKEFIQLMKNRYLMKYFSHTITIIQLC